MHGAAVALATAILAALLLRRRGPAPPQEETVTPGFRGGIVLGRLRGDVENPLPAPFQG